MDLMYYLTQKPITAFLCPHCLKWHEVPKSQEIFTIKDFLNKAKFETAAGYKDKYIYCYNSVASGRPEQVFGYDIPKRNYYLEFKDNSIFFKGHTQEAYRHPFDCAYHRSISGSTTLENIINNCIISDMDDGSLEIIFFIECAVDSYCFECSRYGKENYPFLCSNYQDLILQNDLYYHEDKVRPHCAYVFGFKYKVSEGDPISNLEQVRRKSYFLLDALSVSQNNIYNLRTLVSGIQKYITKDSEDLQTIDTISEKIDALLDSLVVLYNMINSYGETIDSTVAHQELHETFVSKYLYLHTGSISNKLYDALRNKRKKYRSENRNFVGERQYVLALTCHKKARDYIEDESTKILQTFDTTILPKIEEVNSSTIELNRQIRAIQMKYLSNF